MKSRSSRRILFICIIVVGIIVAVAILAAEEQPQITINPDHVLKGTAPTISITLDKSIPDQAYIKTARVGGQTVSVQPPGTDGKLSVPLPTLRIVGQADIEVIGKEDRPVATGKITYVDADGSPPVKGKGLLLLYVALIFALPFLCTIYDIYKSYQERNVVFQRLPASAGIDDIRQLLVNMDQGPTGLIGLTRGLVAVTLLLVLGIAVFHLVVFAPKLPDIADKLLTLLAGTLTAITGFYFGSKAATTPASAPATPDRQKSQTPTISGASFDPTAQILTITGQGFGTQGAKSTLTVAGKSVPVTSWGDQQITATQPAAPTGKVIVVTTDSGDSSQPFTA